MDDDGKFIGFDVIIGNPPYITFLSDSKEINDDEISYFKKNYPLSSVYKMNSYLIFIDKSLQLISKKGLLSFIIPNTIYTNHFYSTFRKHLIDNYAIYSLHNLKYEAFEDATVGGYSIMLLGKNSNETTSLNLISDETKFFVPNKFEINQKEFKRLPDNKFLFSDTLILLWNKCFENSDYLGNKNFKFYQGIVTGDNKRFLNDKRLDERYYPIVRGRNFYKYTPTLYEKYVLFEPELLHSNSNKSMFNVKEKLIIRQTSNHLVATYDDNQMFSLDSTHILFDISDKYNHKYLLALINSKLLNFLYQIIVPEIGKAFSQVKGVNLKKLPIKYISENKQLEFVVIVDKILKVKKEDIAADIQYLENKIDQMVYELYNLNTEEVKLINDSYSQMNKDKKVIKHIQEKLSL